MVYVNNTENESRYKAIRTKYQDAVQKHKVAISLEETHVEIARLRLKEIDDRITELNNSNKVSHEVGQERSKLWALRAEASRKLKDAEGQLAIAKVGEGNMAEFLELVTNQMK